MLTQEKTFSEEDAVMMKPVSGEELNSVGGEYS